MIDYLAVLDALGKLPKGGEANGSSSPMVKCPMFRPKGLPENPRFPALSGVPESLGALGHPAALLSWDRDSVVCPNSVPSIIFFIPEPC